MPGLRISIAIFCSGKAAIEPVDQDIRINESGHAGRGPLCSKLCLEAALPSAPTDACGGARSLGRTIGAVTLDLRVPLACMEE
jgi:hypothetical protein